MTSHFSGHVAILGGPPIRSLSLTNAIATCPLPITRLNAITSDAEFQTRYDPYKAKIVYGRELTRGEIACAQMHLNAYSILASTNAQWLLVLEDDAIIRATWDQILTLVELNVKAIPSHKPSIISLYSTTFVDDNDMPGSSLIRLKVPPSHTVGYWINKAASTYALAHANETFTSADWPPWAVNFDFFRQNSMLMIDHPPGTTIANRERMARWSKSRRLAHLSPWFLLSRFRPQIFKTRRELFQVVTTPTRRRLAQRIRKM